MRAAGRSVREVPGTRNHPRITSSSDPSGDDPDLPHAAGPALTYAQSRVNDQPSFDVSEVLSGLPQRGLPRPDALELRLQGFAHHGDVAGVERLHAPVYLDDEATRAGRTAAIRRPNPGRAPAGRAEADELTQGSHALAVIGLIGQSLEIAVGRARQSVLDDPGARSPFPLPRPVPLSLGAGGPGQKCRGERPADSQQHVDLAVVPYRHRDHRADRVVVAVGAPTLLDLG